MGDVLIVGVCGSVAAYRACDLARDLMRAGWDVRVCLTDAALQFVSAAQFEALTGNACVSSVFEEPVRGRMAHIDWAREASIILIAPATANTICKVASGTADDMLTSIVLASNAPLVVAPAMNPTMYASEPVTHALRVLQSRAAAIVEPGEGEVACGEQGQGKLASNAEIVQAVESVRAGTTSLAGQKVLITSGPTHEPIDDVRFIGNRSSGKMGAALARAALLAGASEVVVVAGPGTAAYPLQAKVIKVQTAQQMLDAALGEARSADWIIGAAAVADYRPANPVSGKIRRSSESMTVELTPNPDIIAELARAAKPGCRVIGFAAEPSTDTLIAQEKLQRKGLAAIAHNDVSNQEIGFESDENCVTLITATGIRTTSPKASKLQVARWIFDQLTEPAK